MAGLWLTVSESRSITTEVETKRWPQIKQQSRAWLSTHWVIIALLTQNTGSLPPFRSQAARTWELFTQDSGREETSLFGTVTYLCPCKPRGGSHLGGIRGMWSDECVWALVFIYLLFYLFDPSTKERAVRVLKMFFKKNGEILQRIHYSLRLLPVFFLLCYETVQSDFSLISNQVQI